MKDNYAIGTYEIELLTPNEREYIFNTMHHSVGYIDTAISYNNDYCLSNTLTRDYKIISKIFPNATGLYEFMISNHLKYLGRDRIDIMLIHNPRAPWHELAQLLESDYRFKEVGVSNFDVALLEEYKELIGHYPAYNEIEINPQYCDFETVQFCKQNDIKIIAYTILGGKYKAERMVADYGLPYILNYIRNFADIVIVRPDSMNEANEYVGVIDDLDDDIEKVNVLPTIEKSMRPLDYPLPDIQRFYRNIPTYSNSSATKGHYDEVKCEELDIPVGWEFISEYKVWLRYTIGYDYYLHDILVKGDNLYAILLYDGDKLTKVNKGKVVVRKFVL